LTIDGFLAFTIIMIPTWAVMILAANYEPEILTDDKGLHIRFLWMHLIVKWEDVIGVKPLFLFIKTHWVIRTRSLTPFHRLYGLYSFALYPCLLFSKSITDYDELQKRLKSAIHQNTVNERKNKNNLSKNKI
jgi:hypothetical protein